MKMYSGVKSMVAIKRAVIKNGWPWNQQAYDNGSDWVSFGFVHDEQRYEVMFRPFGGLFMTRDADGIPVTERSTERDQEPWYIALMDFIYKK